MADEPKVPEGSGETPKPKEQETTQPPKEEANSVNQPPKQEETFVVPDKFKDKSVEEIAKAYVEAEKKIGEMSGKVNEAETLRTTISQWEQLGNIIQGNPALYKAIEEEIKNKTNPQPVADTRDDTRITLEQRIIGDFERGYGIDTLEPTKRTELHQKIGTELTEMLDPEGKKTYAEIIQSIPLNKLDKYLDKAYRLATVGDTAERARLEGLIQARQNNEATFNSIPSSGGKSEGISLTEEQRKVAKRLNISEKDYAEQLTKIEENR